jgi:hypothetical protein
MENFIGMTPRELAFQGERNLTIVLEEKGNELDEVTVITFAKQTSDLARLNTDDIAGFSIMMLASLQSFLPKRCSASS